MTRRPFLMRISISPAFPPEQKQPPGGQRSLDWLEERLRARLARKRSTGLGFSVRARRPATRSMRVRYPVMSLRRQPGSGELKLLFVAHRFMGKGGPALLRAHERLRAAGIPVTTTVVSGIPSTARSKREPPACRGPASAPRHVPNARVLELMDEADYFVLPTFHDTFGYVALESLAGGTPVIASATCALPEVVEHGAAT